MKQAGGLCKTHTYKDDSERTTRVKASLIDVSSALEPRVPALLLISFLSWPRIINKVMEHSRALF